MVPIQMEEVNSEREIVYAGTKSKVDFLLIPNQMNDVHAESLLRPMQIKSRVDFLRIPNRADEVNAQGHAIHFLYTLGADRSKGKANAGKIQD